MNVKLESLSYKAQRHYAEVAYSLEGINGRPATQKEILDYILTTQCDIEELVGDPVTWIAEQRENKAASPWISVEDRPLAIITKIGWECTEDGMHEFIAVVPYRDKRKPGKELWWIRHCLIEDEIGLCVVGNDENDPAGWTIQDITHYWPLPAPPESLTDKK